MATIPVVPAAINVVEKPVMDENAEPGSPVNPPKDVADDTSDFDFGTFSTTDEEPTVTVDEGEGITPVTPPPAPTQETVTKPEAVPTPPAAVVPEPTVVTPPPVEAVQPVAPTAPVEPATPEPTAEELNQQYTDWFNRGSDFLATTVYKLDDDTKTKLDSNPSEVIPRLAAQLHMQVLAAATTQAANLIATMYPQLQERASEEDRYENEFYTTYEPLKNHKPVVNEIARVYRHMNPKATPDQAKQAIAAMAMVQLQIVPPQMQTQQQVQSNVPAAVTPTSARGPAAPAAPTGQTTSWIEELITGED